MKVIINENRKKVIINEAKPKENMKVISWLIYMVGYALVLIIVSLLFKSLYISNDYFGLYALLASIIIYFLNKTIKPIIVFLTLPITALTLGLFYPFINVLNLYIVDFILGDKFIISGIFTPFFIAVLISIMNFFMEHMILKPMLERNYYED